MQRAALKSTPSSANARQTSPRVRGSGRGGGWRRTRLDVREVRSLSMATTPLDHPGASRRSARVSQTESVECVTCRLAGKHEAFIQCCLNVGPASATMAQYLTNTGSNSVDSMLFKFWAIVADGGSTYKQHWINASCLLSCYHHVQPPRGFRSMLIYC